MSTSSSACSASRVIDSDKLLYSIPASFRGGFSGDEQIDADVVYQVGGVFFLIIIFIRNSKYRHKYDRIERITCDE